MEKGTGMLTPTHALASTPNCCPSYWPGASAFLHSRGEARRPQTVPGSSREPQEAPRMLGDAPREPKKKAQEAPAGPQEAFGGSQKAPGSPEAYF